MGTDVLPGDYKQHETFRSDKLPSCSTSSESLAEKKMFRLSSKNGGGPARVCLTKPLPPIPAEEPAMCSLTELGHAQCQSRTSTRSSVQPYAVALALSVDEEEASGVTELPHSGLDVHVSNSLQPYAVTPALTDEQDNVFGHYYMAVAERQQSPGCPSLEPRHFNDYAVLEPTTQETVDGASPRYCVSLSQAEDESRYTLPSQTPTPPVAKKISGCKVTSVSGHVPTELEPRNHPSKDSPLSGRRRKPIPSPRSRAVLSVTVQDDTVKADKSTSV